MGLQYVGPDYTVDSNASDVLNKNDVDTEFTSASVSQAVVQADINTAVAAYASKTYVNNALNSYAQPNYLTTEEAGLILETQSGVAGGVAPLNSSGVIPSQFIPDLGAGYCVGPFGATTTYPVTTGSVPTKIADWSIGVQGVTFQPMVFMTLLAGATNGGRPVIEVRISSGAQSYASQTLIARGVGRSCWNDLQAITVVPIPAQAQSGGGGYSPTYNTWLSAWLYDANAQSVSLSTDNIVNAAAYLVRYTQ